MNISAFLGVVRKGVFSVLASDHDVTGSYKLTSITMKTEQPPESGEIVLANYEGKAIIVLGVEDGEWIYSAAVVEQAGLILTAVVQQVFASEGGDHNYKLKYPWV